MSKIQDALHDLQGRKRSTTDNESRSEEEEVGTTGHENGGAEDRDERAVPEKPVSVKPDPPLNLPDPPPPQLSVLSPRHAVDREHLVGIGLLPTLDQATSIADEFRLIKRPLLENAVEPGNPRRGHPAVIMVASAMPGAGKTFCSVNLAASIALERELNVLLVDADVAKPHISNALGLESRAGLIDVLADNAISIEEVLVRTDFNDIQVLPAGQRHSHSTELLASERMSRVLTELATRYSDRIIIMDSPPLLATSEAHALSQKAGQIVLIIEYGKTLQAEVREAINTLDSNKPVNVILNKSAYSGSVGYHRGRYGQYGIEKEKEK